MVKNPVGKNNRYTHKYDDIIKLDYPAFRNKDSLMKHPKMNLDDRAKIFMPFAALKGYEDAIKEKQRVIVPRKELSEESKESIDYCLKIIEKNLQDNTHPVTKVVYFLEEDDDYVSFTGKVAKLNLYLKYIQIVDREIFLDDIYSLEIIGV